MEKPPGRRTEALAPGCKMVSYIIYGNRGSEILSPLPYSVGGKLVLGSAHTHKEETIHKCDALGPP